MRTWAFITFWLIAGASASVLSYTQGEAQPEVDFDTTTDEVAIQAVENQEPVLEPAQVEDEPSPTPEPEPAPAKIEPTKEPESEPTPPVSEPAPAPEPEPEPEPAPEPEPEPAPPIEPSPSIEYTGIASWYRHGDGLTTASRDFPVGTKLRVETLASGKSVEVTVNDYGPTLATGRALDLNLPAFEALAPAGAGVIWVKYHKID